MGGNVRGGAARVSRAVIDASGLVARERFRGVVSRRPVHDRARAGGRESFETPAAKTQRVLARRGLIGEKSDQLSPCAGRRFIPEKDAAAELRCGQTESVAALKEIASRVNLRVV